MSQIDLAVEARISEQRQAIGQIGAQLGANFYKPEGTEVWAGGRDGFEKDRDAIAKGDITGFILNRSPRKFRLKSYRITGTKITKDPITGDVVILINPDDKGNYDLSLPVTNDMIRTGDVSQEAVARALKGDEDAFFLNADQLAKILNRANDAEIRSLTRLRESIDKMIQNIKSAVADNTQKAQAASNEWVKSAIKPDLSDVMNNNATGVVILEEQQ